MSAPRSLAPWAVAVLFAGPAVGASPLPVRLGVISHGDADVLHARYRQAVEGLGPIDGRPVAARVALGTYAEVLDWVLRGKVDVAVLSPGVFAETLADGATATYLATEGLPAATLPWAAPARCQPGVHFEYGAVALVRHESAIEELGDVSRAVADGSARLLFVDRLSAGGYLAPRHALQQIGIAAFEHELSYSHTASLERLLAPPAAGEPEPVAFVYDGATVPAGVDLGGRVRALPFPSLEELRIPGDVWVSRASYPHARALSELLLGVRDREGRALYRDDRPDLAERFRDVMQWRTEAGAGTGSGLDVGEIATLLRHHARTHEEPPRLAVVLSGGGAKCAYQLGAVSVLEDRLARLRTPSEPWLDIQLVVGTSGGAINALPVAMGLTSTPEGRERVRGVWESIDLRRLVRVAPWVAASIGCFWAGLIVVLGHLLSRLTSDREPRTQAAWTVGGLLAFVLVLPFVPTAWFGHHRPLRHLSLWWSFGLPWSPLFVLPWLFAVSRRRRDEPAAAAPLLVLWVLLPLLTTGMLLFGEGTLFRGTGIQAVMEDAFAQIASTDGPVPETPPLPVLSRHLTESGVLRRDLVVTGSGLPPADPADGYFFVAGSDVPRDAAEAVPSFGRLGVDLRERPELLLDVVMGSGAIYPLFPPRRLVDFPRPGEHVDLVDGGFVHNSPVEAAVLWGATHVVNVEASPLAARGAAADHLFGSSLRAFRFLYDQAQLIDARTRERVVVLTLRPEAPHPSVLDFAPAHVRDAIDKGERDAAGARFSREPGPPRFRD